LSKVALPKGAFGRRLAQTLAWIALAVLVAVGVNLAGIGLVGDIDSWTRWLDDKAGYFFVWRLCLYGATIYGWLWMSRRLTARDPSSETHRRLRRAEIAAVGAIVLLEVGLLSL